MPVLKGGERIERYIGDHWAQIDHGGSSRDTVLRSFTPLRVRDRAGEMVAVDLDLEDRGEVLSPASSPSPVEVADRGGKVTLGGSGLALTPTGTDAAQVDGALSAGRGHFTSVATDTDYVVVPMATGVELSWVLRSDRAPETLALELDLPPGTSLREAPVGGPGGLSAPALPARRVELVKDEKVIAAIEPPHAVDADGTEVDVAMAVRDGRLVLDVAHRERDYRFPILVDPVVNDYLSWKEVPGYHDPSVTYNGWSHQQGGCYASACGAVYGYAGSSYHGSGLYAWGQEGHFFTGGRYSQWVWQAPGDAYIYRADFGWAHHDVANSNLYEGIYSVTRGQWENVDISVPPAPGYSIGRYQPYIEPNYLDYDFKTHCQQPCGWGSPGAPAGTPGNIMAFGVQMRSNGTVYARPMAYLGGATVRLHEFNPPYGSTDGGSYSTDGGIDTADGGSYYPHHTGLSEGWVRYANIQSEVAANDNGLGVKTIDLTSPTGWNKPGEADSCNGARANTQDRPCPSYTTRTFNYDTSTMPEGIVPINATARDIVGNQADVASWQVKIDRTPPTGSISGIDEGELARDRDYQITGRATDSLSGVRNVVVTLDNVEKARNDNCPANPDPCSVSFTLDGGDPALTEGGNPHRLEVTGTDQAGNPGTVVTRTFRVDRTAPTTDVEGSLKPETGPWVAAGEQDLLFDAFDEGGTGATGARLYIDGGLVQEAPPQECSAGGCELDHDFYVTTDGYPEGPHTVSVEAVDGAGNTSPPLTWDVRFERTPPNLALSGPLKESETQTLEAGTTYSLVAAATETGIGWPSGMGSLELAVDGDVVKVFEQPCDFGGCPMSRTFEYTVDDFEEGAHTVTVTATDFAGNETSQSFAVNNPTPPAAVCAPTPSPTPTLAQVPADPTVVEQLVRLTFPRVFEPSSSYRLMDFEVRPGLSARLPGFSSTGTITDSAFEQDARDGVTTTVQTPEGPTCFTPQNVGDRAGDSPPQLVNEAAVLYVNTAQATDLIVRATGTGAFHLNQLRDPTAPTTLKWRVALQAGQVLKKLANGTVAIVEPAEEGTSAPETIEGLPSPPTVAQRQQAVNDTELQLRLASDALERAQGNNADRVVGLIPPVWAQDKLGNAVATSMDVEGSLIVMRISPGPASVYPLVTGHEYMSRDAITEYQTLSAAASVGDYAWSADQPAPGDDGTPGSSPSDEAPAEETEDYGDDDYLVAGGSANSLDDRPDIDEEEGDGPVAYASARRVNEGRLRDLRTKLGTTALDAATITNPDYFFQPPPAPQEPNPLSPAFHRPFAPWNLETKKYGAGIPNTVRQFRGWARNAKRLGDRGDVTVTTDAVCGRGCSDKFTPEMYRRALVKLLDVHGHKEDQNGNVTQQGVIRNLMAWNEPQYKGGGRADPTTPGGGPNNGNPLKNEPTLAAQLWWSAMAACFPKGTAPRCGGYNQATSSTRFVPGRIVAGEFAGTVKDKEIVLTRRNRRRIYTNHYFDEIQRQARRLRPSAPRTIMPRVWSFHDYGDFKTFTLHGERAGRKAPILKRYTSTYRDDEYDYVDSSGRRKSAIWLTEVGGINYRFNCKSLKGDEIRRYCGGRTGNISLFGMRRQAAAMSFFLRTMANDFPEVARLYYFQFQTEAECNAQRAGRDTPNDPSDDLRCPFSEFGLVGARDDDLYRERVRTGRPERIVLAGGTDLRNYTSRAERRYSFCLFRDRLPKYVKKPSRLSRTNCPANPQ